MNLITVESFDPTELPFKWQIFIAMMAQVLTEYSENLTKEEWLALDKEDRDDRILTTLESIAAMSVRFHNTNEI